MVTIIENWADLDIVSPMGLEMHPDKFVLEYAGNIGRVYGLQAMTEDIEIADNNKIEFNLWGTRRKSDLMSRNCLAISIVDI